MKVPEELRRNKSFDSNYCALVKALVPTRSHSGGSQPPTTPTETTPTETTPSSAAIPPRKPQRKNRLRRSTVASGESSSALEVSSRVTGLKQTFTEIPFSAEGGLWLPQEAASRDHVSGPDHHR